MCTQSIILHVGDKTNYVSSPFLKTQLNKPTYTKNSFFIGGGHKSFKTILSITIK